MVCTTIRPTILPYPEIADWEKCSKFVGDHLNYESLDMPTIIVSTHFQSRNRKLINHLMMRTLTLYMPSFCKSASRAPLWTNFTTTYYIKMPALTPFIPEY